MAVFCFTGSALGAEPGADADIGHDQAASNTTEGVDEAHENFGAYLNPLGVLFNVYLAEFDVRVAERVALSANAQYISLDVAGVESTGIGGGLGARIFLQDKVFEGFYAAPSLQYQNVSVEAPGISFLGIEVEPIESSYTALGPRVVGGYQWNFHPLTVRAGIGGTYWFATEDEVELEGIALDVDGAIGLVF